MEVLVVNLDCTDVYCLVEAALRDIDSRTKDMEVEFTTGLMEAREKASGRKEKSTD